MAGEKCLFPHHTVDEQPNRKPKKSWPFTQEEGSKRKTSTGKPRCKVLRPGLRIRFAQFTLHQGSVWERKGSSLGKNTSQKSSSAKSLRCEIRGPVPWRDRKRRAMRPKQGMELWLCRVGDHEDIAKSDDGHGGQRRGANQRRSDDICQRLGLVCQRWRFLKKLSQFLETLRGSWVYLPLDQWSKQTTSHQKWQENWLQCIKLCATRSPWFICELFYDAHTYFNHHLHHRIPLMTLADTPKIQYQKEVGVRVRSYGETRSTKNETKNNVNTIHTDSCELCSQILGRGKVVRNLLTNQMNPGIERQKKWCHISLDPVIQYLSLPVFLRGDAKGMARSRYTSTVAMKTSSSLSARWFLLTSSVSTEP